jgi:hypothetical protein
MTPTRPRIFVSIEKGTITEIASTAEVDLVVFDVDRMKRAEFEAYELERVTVAPDTGRVEAAVAEAEAAVARLAG